MSPPHRSSSSSKLSNCSANKIFGNHAEFISRISKTLYYGDIHSRSVDLDLLDELSLPLTELSSELFSEAQYGYSLHRLDCSDVAQISRGVTVSPCSFILALVYLERLKASNPDYLKQIQPLKLFLVSLMISSKFLEDADDQVFADEWAESAGLSTEELIGLEKEFLAAMEWKVFVSQTAFLDRLTRLEAELALRQGSARGWFTYTEVQTLLGSAGGRQELLAALQAALAVSTVLLATYTIGLLTLAGSVFVASQVPGTALCPSSSSSPAILPADDRLCRHCNETTAAVYLTRPCDYTTSSNNHSNNIYDMLADTVQGLMKENHWLVDKFTMTDYHHHLSRHLIGSVPVKLLL